MASTLKVQNIQHTGGTAAQTIQTSGAVSTPNVPFCRITVSGSSNPAFGGSTPDTVPITISNARGITTPATNQFGVSTTGIYRWEGSFRFSSGTSANYYWVALYDVTNSRFHNSTTINGTFDSDQIPYKLVLPDDTSNFGTVNFSHIYQLEAGDAYSIYAGIAGGATHVYERTQTEMTLIWVG